MNERREIAEALGWRVVFAESNPGYAEDWYDLTDPAGTIIRPISAASEEEAWQIATDMGLLPDWTRDPAAALGLLAGDGLEYELHTVVSANHRALACTCRHVGTDPLTRYQGWAPVEHGDEAAAFALAARRAWRAWREGGEGEGG
jgi:hypothetical protein